MPTRASSSISTELRAQATCQRQHRGAGNRICASCSMMSAGSSIGDSKGISASASGHRPCPSFFCPAPSVDSPGGRRLEECRQGFERTRCEDWPSSCKLALALPSAPHTPACVRPLATMYDCTIYVPECNPRVRNGLRLRNVLAPCLHLPVSPTPSPRTWIHT